MLDFSSKRNSAEMSSESRPRSNESPQTQSGRQTPSASLSSAPMASDGTSRDGNPMKAVKSSPIQEEWRNSNPIELPGDIPEDALRNAPVSVKNRLSMTLGLKPRDNTDHRISSIYYPKALGDLLKIPQSPRYKASPQLVAARGTAVRSNSPLADADADYFSAHERSPSIGHITPETRKFLDLDAMTPENPIPRISVRSPTVPQGSEQRRTSVPNPGLTSHRSVMMMASPPVELSAVTETIEKAGRPVSRSRQESQSSLGEPGPEIAEPEGEIFHQADVEITVIPPQESKSTSDIVHELWAETLPMNATPAQPQSASIAAGDSISGTTVIPAMKQGMDAEQNLPAVSEEVAVEEVDGTVQNISHEAKNQA